MGWIPEGDDRVSIGMYIRSPPKGPFVSAGSRDEIETDFARVEPDRPGASADALPRVPLANYTPWRPGSKPICKDEYVGSGRLQESSKGERSEFVVDKPELPGNVHGSVGEISPRAASVPATAVAAAIRSRSSEVSRGMV